MSDPANVSEAKHAAPFGVATATFVVVSSMIGTGVLTTSGFTMYFVGSNQLMLAMWVVGGLVAICGALSLAELAAALPRSGGDYVFLYEAYGPLAGFLSGWVSFLIGFGAPIAASASAAGKYLLEPAGLAPAEAQPAQMVLATGIILALTAVHAHSRPGTVRVQAVTTLVKVAILASLAAAGLYAGWGRWENLDDRPPLTSGTAMSILFSMVYISYAYTGWNGAGFLAGEVCDPRRNLPRSILLGTGLVVLLYLALNLFYALALSTSDVKAIVEAPGNAQGPDAVTQIAGLSAARFFGPGLAGLISVAIGLTMLASLSAFILTGPRVIYAMSRAGQFPAFAGRLHPRSGTPHLATWLQAAWAIAVLWSGSFEKILVFASVGLALFSLLTVSAVYALRLRRPDLHRPFRTPGYPIVPGVYLLMTILMTGAAFSERPDASLLSVACIVAGVPLAGGRKSSALAVTTLGGWGLSLLLAETKVGPLLGWWNAPGMLASQGPWFVNGVAALALGAIAGLSLRRIAGASRAGSPLPLPYCLCLIACATVGVALLTAPKEALLPMLAAAFAIWAVVEVITPWPLSMRAPREGNPPA